MSALEKRVADEEVDEENRKRKRLAAGVLDDYTGRAEPERDLTPPPPAPPSPLPALFHSRRSGRALRVPKRLQDMVPSTKEDMPGHLANAFPDPEPQLSPCRYISPTVEDVPEEDASTIWRTEPNEFGIHREYTESIGQDPEAGITLDSLCDSPTLARDTPVPIAPPKSIFWLTRHSAVAVNDDPEGSDGEDMGDTLGPFGNKSQFRLFDWWYNSSVTKSLDDFDELLDVLRSRGFSLDDLVGFRAKLAQQMLDDYVHPSGVFSGADGWDEGSVPIPLPKTRAKYKSEEDAPSLSIGGIFHRSITAVIRGVAEDPRFAHIYQWRPHHTFWQPPSPPSPTSTPSSSQSTTSTDHDADRIRIYTDIFNSDHAFDAYEEVRKQPRNPSDAPSVEYTIFQILIASDATHLTNFGSAALWPIYLYFGALSKYFRGMPTLFTAQHLAYIPSLPDSIQDAYMKAYGTAASKDVMTFCKRELMQRIWLLLLDDEFMDAYKNGIVVVCGDGVIRRIFPRFMTYSADYPEKILITALKPLARCLCPRCLVEKDNVHNTGLAPAAEERIDNAQLRRDILKARRLVFTKGISLAGKRVQALLDSRSLNPIQSAFSVRLAEFNVNFYELFAPDLLHEFEIGVWKGIFLHLLRLVAAQGVDMTKEFNRRMRAMPTFGRDKIRRFWNDVAACKNLAARDYEDFLICMMPVFEGLLPLQDDETVADLLFELVNWHALAKLRLHTEVTLDIFEAATGHMYEAVRAFAATTCHNHETHELEKEVEARVRQAARRKPGAPPDRARKIVKYKGMHTVKYHMLSHYAPYIRRSGTTDNYSSQNCELEHRHVKRFYARTNKIGYSLQIAKHQRRAALLRALRQRDDYVPRRVRHQSKKASAPLMAADSSGVRSHPESDGAALPPTSPLDHHAISQVRHIAVNMRSWLVQNRDDPATKNFIPMLNLHLLGRILDEPADGFDNAHLRGIEIQRDRIYRHKVLRINYTTYDMRRDQDTINPRTHPDVMLLAPDDEADAHPYWYGRVIDIFHAQVRYTGPGATPRTRQWQRIEFVWVRWFELDPSYAWGFQERRLPRLRFINAGDVHAVPFGFVDPSDILRAAYIMPAFAYGHTSERLSPSHLARQPSDNDEDYELYYASMFVDRDMYMRYLGGGVGHRGIGISLATSREHSLRQKPAGPLAMEDEEMADGAPVEDDRSTGQDVNEDEDEGEFVHPWDDNGNDSRGLGLCTDEGEDEDDEFVRPWDDDGDDGHDLGLWTDEEGEGGAALARALYDAEGIGADLAEDEDFYLDDVYAAEGYAPY